jgi:hypothetical protein
MSEGTPLPVVMENQALSTEAIINITFVVAGTLGSACVFAWKIYRSKYRGTGKSIGV